MNKSTEDAKLMIEFHVRIYCADVPRVGDCRHCSHVDVLSSVLPRIVQSLALYRDGRAS